MDSWDILAGRFNHFSSSLGNLAFSSGLFQKTNIFIVKGQIFEEPAAAGAFDVLENLGQGALAHEANAPD